MSFLPGSSSGSRRDAAHNAFVAHNKLLRRQMFNDMPQGDPIVSDLEASKDDKIVGRPHLLRVRIEDLNVLLAQLVAIPATQRSASLKKRVADLESRILELKKLEKEARDNSTLDTKHGGSSPPKPKKKIVPTTLPTGRKSPAKLAVIPLLNHKSPPKVPRPTTPPKPKVKIHLPPRPAPKPRAPAAPKISLKEATLLPNSRVKNLVITVLKNLAYKSPYPAKVTRGFVVALNERFYEWLEAVMSTLSLVRDPDESNARKTITKEEVRAAIEAENPGLTNDLGRRVFAIEKEAAKTSKKSSKTKKSVKKRAAPLFVVRARVQAAMKEFVDNRRIQVEAVDLLREALFLRAFEVLTSVAKQLHRKGRIVFKTCPPFVLSAATIKRSLKNKTVLKATADTMSVLSEGDEEEEEEEEEEEDDAAEMSGSGSGTDWSGAEEKDDEEEEDEGDEGDEMKEDEEDLHLEGAQADMAVIAFEGAHFDELGSGNENEGDKDESDSGDDIEMMGEEEEQSEDDDDEETLSKLKDMQVTTPPEW